MSEKTYTLTESELTTLVEKAGPTYFLFNFIEKYLKPAIQEKQKEDSKNKDV